MSLALPDVVGWSMSTHFMVCGCSFSLILGLHLYATMLSFVTLCQRIPSLRNLLVSSAAPLRRGTPSANLTFIPLPTFSDIDNTCQTVT